MKCSLTSDSYTTYCMYTKLMEEQHQSSYKFMVIIMYNIKTNASSQLHRSLEIGIIKLLNPPHSLSVHTTWV